MVLLELLPHLRGHTELKTLPWDPVVTFLISALDLWNKVSQSKVRNTLTDNNLTRYKSGHDINFFLNFLKFSLLNKSSAYYGYTAI